MAGKSHHKRKSNRAGHPLRVEPSSAEIFEALSDLRELFRKAEWLKFCVSLKGYHPQVVNAFTSTFNGYEAVVSGLTIRVSEESLSCAFALPLDGEHWFKNQKVDEDSLLQFLKPECQNPNWNKGVPAKHLQEKWGSAMIAIKQYITCEGRYKCLYKFHFRFLLHLTGQRLMNLPFYLIKDLTKISTKIQKNPMAIDSSLAHHSLITMIVFNQVIKAGLSIRSFLNDAGFLQKEKLQEKVKSKIKKAAFTFLPVEEDEIKANLPVQEDQERPEVKSKVEDRVIIRAQAKKQQALLEPEIPPIMFEEQIVEERIIERQSDFIQEPRRRITRAANKFRLKGKALLDPSLKGKEPIEIEDDLPTPVKTKSKKSQARNVKLLDEPTIQAPSTDLLIQLADIAEFLETRSEDDILEEIEILFAEKSKVKTPGSEARKEVRRSKRKHVSKA